MYIWLHKCLCTHAQAWETKREWFCLKKLHEGSHFTLTCFGFIFWFYFVGVRCTFVIIKPVAPSQFNSGTCQVPGGGHGVSDRVNMLVKPSNSKWNQHEPTKTLEGSVQRLSVNQYLVSTLTYGKDQKKTRILIICQWNFGESLR